MPGCFSTFKTRFFSSKTKALDIRSPPNDLVRSHICEHTDWPCDFAFSTDHSSLEDWCKDEGLPPPYEVAQDVFFPEAVKTIEERIQDLDHELRELSLEIHDNPEIGFEEKHTHDVLTEFMSSHGFEVTRHYLGLETAWRAEFKRGTGGRILGFNSEMDALPGIGHACGHNLIAIAGVAAALGVKSALEKHEIDGTIVLLGTPAEEGGMGKVLLIERGGYDGMDACLMVHPTPGPKHSAGTGSSMALQEIQVEYFGRTSHAAMAPWNGQNALDAAFLAYSAVSVLRQQIKPDHRVHGIVEGRDWAPNIIPDYAKMRWYVRAPTFTEVEVLRERVIACFEAAGLATACRFEIKKGTYAYDLRQNLTLANEFRAAVGRYGVEVLENNGLGGSTDFGSVTYELPSLHPSYAIPTEPEGGNHTRSFAASARTKEAHKATLKVSNGIAVTGFRILADKEFTEKVKASFRRGETAPNVNRRVQ